MRVFKTLSHYLPLLVVFFVGLAVGLLFAVKREGFQVMPVAATCNSCGQATCPAMPDMSKYTLKSSIPPPVNCPDMSQYMLKTQCPPVPDLSQYVLKSSVPTPEPIIVDTSSCNKGECGECPPCPRPRCPDVKCPPPTVCPACPPCQRQTCPQTTVKCKAEETPDTPVRPYLSPLNMGGFGS
jgi:hypothetical protein